MTVVCTRSSACIHSIPTYAANKTVNLEHPGAVDRLRCLVHEKVDDLVVEHLSILKSEAMLSSTIDSWTKDERKKILLLLVDMSSSSAFERTNYTRMCVEQRLRETEEKSFILLLHYPPSSAHRQLCYPALFLGGWEHFFLDGVGSQGLSLGIEQLIEAACRCGKGDDPRQMEQLTSCFSQFILTLLPRVIPHVASQKIFYRRQEKNGRSSFVDRTSMLLAVMNATAGSSNVATIVCSKFARMWASRGLLNSMNKASEGLLLGTTQLSLTMSIHSAIVEAFDTFLTTEVIAMNQWFNLDIILETVPDEKISELFGLILEDLPIMPFEELVLQTTRCRAMQLSPLEDPRNESAEVRFPFFRLVSSFLDECIEKAEQTLAQEQAATTHFVQLSHFGEELLLRTMQIIRELVDCDCRTPGNQSVVGRAGSVLNTIALIQAENDDGTLSLFDRYLQHFIAWSVGCKSDPLILGWVGRELDQYGPDRNIVAVHIVARLKSREMVGLASITTAAKSFSLRQVTQTDDERYYVPSASTGDELFEQLLAYFECNLFSDNMSSLQWSASFSRFIQQIHAMLSGRCIDDLDTLCRLRVLCFFRILIEASAITRVQQKSAKLWRKRGDTTVDEWAKSMSLGVFFEAVRNSDGESDALAEELALRFFFSPTWMQISMIFKENDFDFLLRYISEGNLAERHHQLAVMLLHLGCFHDASTDMKGSMPVLSEVRASHSLFVLNSNLACAQVAVFSNEGERSCIPHFVPEWLQRDRASSSLLCPSDSAWAPFLCNYVHCFECVLSNMAFHMVLQILLCEAEEASSETLLLRLLHGVHAETSITRVEQTRLSRSRKAGEGWSLVGSPLGAIILDARLICFISKVAYEIAVDQKAAAFHGAYAREALSLFEELMSLEHLKWQEFFICSIIRISGDGALSVALGENGPLNSMAWCQPWIQGMPSQKSEAAQSLKKAEDALAEAEAEEDRKTQEMRFCPYCRQAFVVRAENCGQFVCGRDFHGGQQPTGFGCGQPFQLVQAGYYALDESLLAPLRARVAEERSKFREREHAASLWDSARSMQVPTLAFKIEGALSRRSLLPCSSFLLAVPDSDTSGIVSLVKLLLEGSTRAAQYLLLPDLIEVRVACEFGLWLYCVSFPILTTTWLYFQKFYMWLHDTFRYLVTRERAFQLKISGIMKKEMLQRRFDSVAVDHITALWGRVTTGVNSILREAGHKIAWQCEEIQVSFDLLEEASLVALLSEGDHPTDGNDVLFLLINDIIGGYNNFVSRLVECVRSCDQDSIQQEHEVNPKFVATGCGGAVSMSAAVPLLQSELKMMVQSCWNSVEETYDLTKLDASLRSEISLQSSPPLISNPSQCLRGRFRFRDDRSKSLVDNGMHVPVLAGQEGEFFANSQDFQLADNVRELLVSFGMITTNQEARRTLNDVFFTFGYEQLRLMLEGCRSLLASTSVQFTEFPSVDQILRTAMNLTDRSLDYNMSDALRSFGFPDLTHAQSQLLVTLDQSQFVDLVNYLAYQLASEAYLFANLPLCMTDPLQPSDRDKINSNLVRLCKEHGVESTVGAIEGFTRDILSYYEKQIRDECAMSNVSLKSFLEENNFCDDSSDPVFALVPKGVTLHNYISLRQHLHQRKLALLVKTESSSTATKNGITCHIDDETVELFTRPSRGRCWLWEAEDGIDTEEVVYADKEGSSTQYNDKWCLWFESLSEDESKEDECAIEMEDTEIGADSRMAHESDHDEATMEVDKTSVEVDESKEIEEQGLQGRCAVLLQRWWRHRRSQFDEYDYDDIFEDCEEFIINDQESFSMDADVEQEDLDTVTDDRSNGSPSDIPTVYGDILFEDCEEFIINDQESVSVDADAEQDDLDTIMEDRSDDSPPNDIPTVSNETEPAAVQPVYGSLENQTRMKKWLDENRLPQSLGNELMDLGARDIEDVAELVETHDDIMARMKPLDRAKLKKAVKSYRSESHKVTFL